MHDIAPGETRTWDGLFDLVNLVHHTVEGVEQASKAAAHARQLGDIELAEFFEGLEQQLNASCTRARALIESRKGDRSSSRDTVEESSMESFPASDPPSSY